MRLRIALALIFLSATSAPALEAITYKGTIGRIPIILELADPAEEGLFVGRYAYRAKGVDIPLRGKTDIDGKLAIEEEAPCDARTCKDSNGDTIEKAPIGADWTLTSDKAGAQLKGTWKDRKSGKSLAISLTKVGGRILPDGAQSMGLDGLDPSSVTRDVLSTVTPNLLPYDFLKFDEQKVKRGPETDFNGATIRSDTDPLTGTTYPTIVNLPGAETTAVNAWLRQQWLQFQFNPYYCKSRAYLSYGWSGNESDGSNGYWDDTPDVSIEYLSTRLLALSESGSFYCGGAYPAHFVTRHFAEVGTGKPLRAENLIKGFIQTNSAGEPVDPASVAKSDYVTYRPNAELEKFIDDRRDKSDASLETDCTMSELVRTNLGVYFTKDELVFNLKDLPHVIFACTDDVVRIPMKDARPLLNAEGVRLLLGG
ncbi:hypothetical protein [Rhizobium sp.]